MMKGLEVCCAECGTVFDLANPDQAEEWAYGHECPDEVTE
jgi:hypothetical protein